MPNALLELTSNALRMGRSSPELRAYSRDEWGSDAAWLYRRVPRTPLLAKLRAWLRRPTRTRPPSPAAADPRSSAGFTAVPRAVEADDDCLHPTVEDLGFGGTAEFLRCTLCGDVLVVDEGRRWAFVSAAPVSCDEVPCE